jgi:hypothetical protein
LIISEPLLVPLKMKEKEKKEKLTLEEATAYLKKLGEWETAWKFDRETIIKWAEFLKNKNAK